ncbi:MAG: 30S ribosomal protein S6 [Bdellovibrionales bacterium]|nr:30S ribosomal protein S6 [Bdellovibrionales bacterium]
MAKAVAGKLAGYETTFITRPEMGDDALRALTDRLISIVPTFGGELVLQEDWGTKRLAYKIEKETRGHYTYLVYTGEGNIVAEIERNLRMNDFVMRFLSVNLAKEFEKDSFMKRREEIKAQAKKREEEREARREEREARRRSYEESNDEMGAEIGE